MPAGLVLALALLLLGAGSASAATPAAGWTIASLAAPTDFSPSADAQCAEDLELCDSYVVSARNAGSVPTNGQPATLTDALPEGLELRQVEFTSELPGATPEYLDSDCTSVPLECRFAGAVQPDQTLRMIVSVSVKEGGVGGTESLANVATVAGGGAPAVSSSTETGVGAATPPFGVASFEMDIAGLDGLTDTQAGAHPYQLTATIDLNSVFRNDPEGRFADTSVQDLKDLVIDLPLGLLAGTRATPTCTLVQLESAAGCPPDTALGRIGVEPEGGISLRSELYNLVPEHGVPAELGYTDLAKTSHVLYASVAPTPAGYVLRVTARELPQVALTAVNLTFFGDPAATDGNAGAQSPLLTNPSACSGQPLETSVYLDSWQDPGADNADGTPNLADPAWVSASSQSPPVTGCNLLRFDPELSAQPTTDAADSPTGLELELKSPTSESPEVDATPPLERAVVALPEGITVDPSAGNGLQACSIAQIGWLGGGPQNFDAAPPQCPEQAKIGSVELTTPLFSAVLTGAVYLAAQDENPFQSALAAYLVVEDPATGVVLKIPAELKADPHTGRLMVVLAESPQLPFSDLKLHFSSGPRALLATPASCGAYTTTSELTPWSALEEDPTDPGAAAAGGGSGDGFTIDAGCVDGFAPSFVAGVTNVQAGAYTPFEASFSRGDADQELDGWSVTLPPGLLADIGSVPLCPQAAANNGTCPEASRVGTVLAEAGAGPDPLSVPGKAYLTGPYNGGPYGLSVVVPVSAGPLDLGAVVVRQSLRIGGGRAPNNAQITDVSNPFPTVLDVTGANGQTDGIPIRLRRVDVTFERPGGAPFMFNPTSCAKLPLTGSISSAQGASTAVSSPFQVTDCASLKFTPKLTAATQAKTSRAGGASLSVKLTYPAAPHNANIAALKVDLPKALPARLRTLRQACLARVFAANPAACPAASIVGRARVLTPILPVALEGPAYFVGRGPGHFQGLDLVLSGDGVRIDLAGTTFIDAKTNVTSLTFRAMPDIPVSSLELSLPEGPHSALAANAALCKRKLAMPTALVGQNGAQIHESTKVGVTGCPPGRSPTRARKLTPRH
jgi:hypothetical protein